LYLNACNGWPQFALQHHWLLPNNCHFLRLYSATGRGIATVSSAIEESDLYLFYDQQTDRQTRRQRHSVCSKRPHLDISAMRPNNSNLQCQITVTRWLKHYNSDVWSVFPSLNITRYVVTSALTRRLCHGLRRTTRLANYYPA